MKPNFFIAAVAAATLAGAPAVADDWRDDRREWREDRRDDRRDWRNDRRDWREDRRAQRDAYRAGFRAGQRADDRRDGYWYNGRWVSSARYGQGYGWNGNTGYRYPVSSRDWVQGRDYWYGRDGRAYCRRADGTTGTIVGAVAGGTLGNVIAGQGDKTLGSVIGGTVGAILGREIARGQVRCR